MIESRNAKGDIEFRDEVYAVLDAMDTKYTKFGPDVGQLAKGGSDPVKKAAELRAFDGRV